jgi:DNA-binding response OmpR family regulator
MIETDPRRRIISRNGTSIKLGPAPFRMVEILVQCPNGLEREALRARVYCERHDGGPSDDSFTVTISELRRKLRPLGVWLTKANRWDSIYQLIAGAP